MHELRLKLEEVQKNIVNNMQQFSIPVDLKDISVSIDRIFEGLNIQETIIQYSRLSAFDNIEKIKNQLEEEHKKFIFLSLGNSMVMNQEGRFINSLPPLDLDDFENNSELLENHMIRFASEQRNLNAIPLKIAYKYFEKFDTFEEEDLNFLVDGNPIVPVGRNTIIKEGLYLGLTGKLYAAMHILLPQTEHLIRNLVRMCGDTITYLKDDDTEEYKPLSQLLKSSKLYECYDKNIIFTFKSFLDSPYGENLRNLNAHGVLEPSNNGDLKAMYFLSLFIQLIARYSLKTLPILESLNMKKQ